MWYEFVYGLRKARSEKLSSILFILLLTIGLSTTAVVGGLLNSVVLKSLPVRDPNSLLLLEKNEERQVRPGTTFSYRQFQAVQQRRDLFSDAVAQQVWSGTSPLRSGSWFWVRLQRESIPHGIFSAWNRWRPCVMNKGHRRLPHRVSVAPLLLKETCTALFFYSSSL